MTKFQEQLEFAVRLAQTKLSDLRPGDMLNLREDLDSFFTRKGEDMRGPIGEVLQPIGEPQAEQYSVADFEALQKEVNAILNGLVTSRDSPSPRPVAGMAVSPGIVGVPRHEIKASLIAASFHGINNRAILMANGSVRDMFLLRLFLLLGQEPFDRILRCKAPDCDRIFYRRRKQEFCSTKCTNRAYMKTYRKEVEENPVAAAAATEKEHARYKKRARKLNPKKKVARRPRPKKKLPR